MKRRAIARLIALTNAVVVVGACASAESPAPSTGAPTAQRSQGSDGDRAASPPQPDASTEESEVGATSTVTSAPPSDMPVTTALPPPPPPHSLKSPQEPSAVVDGKRGAREDARDAAAQARTYAGEKAKDKKSEAAGAPTTHPVTSVAGSIMPAPDGAAPISETAQPGGTFVHAGTNPFIDTLTDALSTFSIDVDTGSFTFARRFLREGNLPPDAAVRVEEWVNAMHYEYASPPKSQAMPFAVHVDGAPSPIARGKHLVRVALQGKKVSKAERNPTHLVFLVDVSGSMDASDKLPLARDALHMMVDELRDDDSIALVTYAGATGVVLPATSVKNKRTIHQAIDKLHSGGGTNMGSGLELAYREAAKQLGGGRSARVVVLSDGDANIGRTSHQEILRAVKGYVSEGVMMTTVGFGTGNYNDHLMEQLANAGNGAYSYIDSKKTAERFFVHELDGTLETIAQDVKIQVEWNPAMVARYRLVGYENRDIADKDFRNDKKDAGEIGAGHAVTALYELELTSSSPSEALGTVRIRAKKPRGTRAEEMDVAIPATSIKERPGDLDHNAQTAAATALAAEILRGSPHAEGRTLAEAASLLREAATGPFAAERLELARELMKVEPRVARR